MFEVPCLDQQQDGDFWVNCSETVSQNQHDRPAVVAALETLGVQKLCA